jgi:hypothetical protein
MMLHIFDFFRRMLPIQAVTPEPAHKPLRKPSAKKATDKKSLSVAKKKRSAK